MAPSAAVSYKVKDIKASIRHDKAADVYLTFNVKSQLGTKASTSVVSADSESLSWLTEVLDLEVLEPINAILEVQAYSKRTLLPDHCLGEFSQTLTRPGSSDSVTGTLLSKKGDETGSVTFTLASNQTHRGDTSVSSTGQPANAPGKTLPTAVGSAAPTVGAANATGPAPTATSGSGAAVLGASGAGGGAVPASKAAAHGHSHPVTGSTTDQARAKADLVAQEASAKTNTTANAASGKTVGTIDGAEQKLQNLKDGLSQRARPPTSPVPGASESGGQSAFNKTIGIPADAKTASDAPGNASAGNAPYDAAAGGAAGSVTGPVAPTGQGGILAQTGATSIAPPTGGGPGQTVVNAAYTAADKAQRTLEAAKRQFGSSKVQHR